MKELVSRYDAAVVEEQELSPEKRIVANVGKMDAKKHLAANVTSAMSSNINQVGAGRGWERDVLSLNPLQQRMCSAPGTSP